MMIQMKPINKLTQWSCEQCKG